MLTVLAILVALVAAYCAYAGPTDPYAHLLYGQMQPQYWSTFRAWLVVAVVVAVIGLIGVARNVVIRGRRRSGTPRSSW